MEQFKIKNKLFLLVIVTALVVGGAAGAIAGFYTSTLSAGNLAFLSGPLAIKNGPSSVKSADLQEQNSIIAAVKKGQPGRGQRGD